MEESKKPALRFKGFHDDWEQRKLGEIADYKKGPFGSALKKEIFIPKSENSVKVYEQQNAIGKNWKLERYFITKEYANELKAFETHGGDILVSCAGTIGEMYELPDNSEVGVINQALMRVRVNEKIISKELYKLLFTNMIDDFSKEHSNGSAMKNIPPFADLKAMNVMLPTLDEQERIGAYFNKLDHLITLHQRKYESLVNIKKAMLEKMFPKNEEVVPELRFAGFTDTWEQRKLSDVCSEIGDGLHSAPVYDENGKYYFINGNNLVNSKIIVNETETKRVSEETFKKNNKNLDDTTILLSINGTIGNLAYYNDEMVMLGKSAAYLKVMNIEKKFLYTSLQTSNTINSFMSSLTGTTIKNLGLEAIKKTQIFMPCEKEQTAIGKYFQNLDNLITLHQRELEKLQNIKKSCLEKMFI